jgi:hypothetical protein
MHGARVAGLASGCCGFRQSGAVMIGYLRYVGLLLTFALVMTSRAVAIDVTVGQTKLTLVPPKGFCPFDRRQSLDSQTLDMMQQAVQGRNEVLGVFADCQLLKMWRSGESDNAGEIFSYTVSLRAKNLDATARTDIPSMCNAFRKQGAAIAKDAQAISADNLKAIKELAGKLELNSTQMYGVLHEDNAGCYFGTVQKYKIEESVETTFSAKVVTVVKRKIIFTELEGGFQDESAVKRLLAAQRETIAALLARNR